MTERMELIKALRRIELARLHAGELNRALFPDGRHDDDISDEAKAGIQSAVAAISAQHRAEVSAWEEANR